MYSSNLTAYYFVWCNESMAMKLCICLRACIYAATFMKGQRFFLCDIRLYFCSIFLIVIWVRQILIYTLRYENLRQCFLGFNPVMAFLQYVMARTYILSPSPSHRGSHIDHLIGSKYPFVWLLISLLCRRHPTIPVIPTRDPMVSPWISACLSDISTWMREPTFN